MEQGNERRGSEGLKAIFVDFMNIHQTTMSDYVFTFYSPECWWIIHCTMGRCWAHQFLFMITIQHSIFTWHVSKGSWGHGHDKNIYTCAWYRNTKTYKQTQTQTHRHRDRHTDTQTHTHTHSRMNEKSHTKTHTQLHTKADKTKGGKKGEVGSPPRGKSSQIHSPIGEIFRAKKWVKSFFLVIPPFLEPLTF